MTKRISIDISGPAYKNPSIPANNQRCVNWYPTSSGPSNDLEANNPLEKGRGTPLLRTMGAKFLANIGTGTCRGIWNINPDLTTNITVVAIGANIYKLTFNKTNFTLTSTQLTGTLNTSTGPISMTYNDTYMMFVSNNPGISGSIGYVWAYNVNNNLVSISDPDYNQGSHVVMIDNYFIVNNPGTPTMQASDLNLPTSWNALSVAKANSNPDYLVGLGQTKGELWAFGTNSIEVWYDAANPTGFPFSKRVGSDLDVGCSASRSIQSVNGTLIWLDSRRFLAQSDYSNFFRNQSSGYNIMKLSNEAIDAEFASYSKVYDAIASTYNDRGHIMYEITFPTANKTWVYDTTLHMWHEKSYFNSKLGTYNASRTNFYAQYDEYVLSGCNNSNAVYVMSRDMLTDAGEPIHRIRTTQHYTEDFNEITVNELEIKANTGIVPNPTANTNLETAISTSLSTINSVSAIASSITKVTKVITSADIGTSGGVSVVKIAKSVINGDNTYDITTESINGVVTFAAGDMVAFCYNFYNNTVFLLDEKEVFPGQIVSVTQGTMQGINVTTVKVKYVTGFPTLDNLESFGVFSDSVMLYSKYSPGSLPAGFFTYYAPVNIVDLSGSTPVTFTLSDSSTYSTTIPPFLAQNQTFELGLGKHPISKGATFNIPVTSYVVSIQLATTQPIFVGDILNIALNGFSPALNSATATAAVISASGSTFTIALLVTTASYTRILTSDVTVGNVVSVLRQVTSINLNDLNPKINLRYSNDSGYTWSYALTRNLGQKGEFGKRLIWGPLGSAREWTLEFKVSDVADVSLTDGSAVIDVESIV